MTALFASRATSLITGACKLAPRRLVLLPALFCTEVAQAIEAAGIQYRCYDVPSDLSSGSQQIADAFDSDVGSILVLHPFGLCRPFDRNAAAGDVLVIEDASHALRTWRLDNRIGQSGSVTVFSLRKELAWDEGGFALGSHAAMLNALVPQSRRVAARWRKIDTLELAREGRVSTSVIAQALGSRLPPIGDSEVLTALPVRSSRRDWCIERLRREGILAWRWRGGLKGVGSRSTPRAWALRQELFLVPLPAGPEIDRVIGCLAQKPLLDWK
jgi:hypothetical protein